MISFLQQVIDGLESGAVYAALALALVLVHRSTGLINFAQGEIAMFSTYVTFTALSAGLPLVVAIVLGMAFSLAGGMLIERALFRAPASRQPLTAVVIMLGLFIGINTAAGLIWSYQVQRMPALFPEGLFRVAGSVFSYQMIGTLAVLLLICLALHLLFAHTKIGLMMRAAVSNGESCRILGINPGTMLGLGWGLAAALGCLAGVLVTPRLFLDPNVMQGIIIFAIAAATVGGLDSALGAVVAGLGIGVLENLAGSYLVGSDLRVCVPLVLIIAILTLRPEGLFGRKWRVRV
ncbi:branched-chain amino acid ABC transporter permease [Bradyrhizobium sp. NP1]|uniref:branched-chain amino acid ABC transporter permease n=1 Tax=Bradyrhizobium sp. NP1 TaxID=3049772 RepID=UPI0025A65FBC|nr:branched-chain amino acid ABC transporter permease [Bradyrhizobium sp. NP1]WJR77909.1 branched-chain amino acid ABC transporter permease [Bradyrhizobium sp. NP1]